MNIKKKSPILDRDLHLKITEEFERKIHDIAAKNHLKVGTIARLILLNHIDAYAAFGALG